MEICHTFLYGIIGMVCILISKKRRDGCMIFSEALKIHRKITRVIKVNGGNKGRNGKWVR